MQRAGQYACPECREPYEAITALPSLESSSILEWFHAVDSDGDGRLSKAEVLQVLKAQYRLDWRALESHIDSLWLQWDQDGSGDLAFHELTADEGLVHYVTGNDVGCSFAVPQLEHKVPPLSDTAAWFTFWDEDGNGSLDRQEVQRALIKTFNLGHDLQQINAMQETLAATWNIFDTDRSGEIDFEEFVAHDGLGQTLALSLAAVPQPISRISSQSSLGG